MAYCKTLVVEEARPMATVEVVDYGFGETRWRNSFFDTCIKRYEDVKDLNEAIGVICKVTNTGFWGSVVYEVVVTYSTPNSSESVALKARQRAVTDGNHTTWLTHPSFKYASGTYKITNVTASIIP